MRPDEHKKKKNAQYKKQHGIETGKKDNKDNKRRGKTEQEPRESTQSHPQSQHCQQGIRQKPVDTEEKPPSFQRRKIVSNWDRYEIEEEQNEGLRGADFQTLLQETSSSLAQFRFKDEQEWEAEISDTTPTAALSIDSAELSAALLCIPLYQRLSIGKDYFEGEDVKLLDKKAEDNLQLYNKKCKNGVENHEQNFTEMPQSKNPYQESQTCRQSTDNDSLLDQLLETDQSDITEKCSSSSNHDNFAKRQSPNAVISDKQTDNIEDDLDFLLSLDTPNEKSKEGAGQTENAAVKSRPSPEEKSPREQTNETICIQKETDTPSESLDDWLDSVLDD